MKNESEADNVLPLGSDLRSVIGRFPQVTKVEVHRTTEKGYQFCGRVVADRLDEDFIQERWKGGVYRLTFRDEQGKIRHTLKELDIADPDEDPELAKARVVGASSTVAAATAFDAVAFLNQQLQEQRVFMQSIIAGMNRQAPAGTTPVTELVTAMATMQKMLPAAPATPIDMYFSMFEKSLAVVSKMQRPSGGDGDNLFADIVREIIDGAKPLIAAYVDRATPREASTMAIVPTVPVSAPTPAADVAQPTTEAVAAFRTSLEFLKDKCRRDKDPVTWAAFALDMLSEKDIDELATWIQQPYDVFISIDSELGNEPYRTWFGKFQEAVIAELFVPADTEGVEGNQGDDRSNGGTDKTSAAGSGRP